MNKILKGYVSGRSVAGQKFTVFKFFAEKLLY